MHATSSRADQSAVANRTPSPAVDAAPTPEREEERRFRLRAREWGNRFAARLKTNIQWMKQFLHRRK